MRLDKRIQAFDERRRALLDEMESMEPGKLLARPRPGKWTLLEIIEHLVLAERVVYEWLADPSELTVRKTGLKDRIRYLTVRFVLRNGIPVGIASPAMTPQGGRELAELRRLWDENQAWLRACIESLDAQGIRGAVLAHPIAGPLDMKQVVVLTQDHLDTHLRQIRVLQRLLG